MRIIQKWLYNYAYSYAEKCQEVYFTQYILKYIKKHIKYRNKSDEYELLIIVIDNDENKFFENNAKLLSNEKHYFSKFLYDINRRMYKKKRTNYTYRAQPLQNQIDAIIYDYAQNSSIQDRDMIEDIVKYSIELQDMFQKSNLVAKTKIQEHWFMRLPIYIMCMTLILVLKLYETREEKDMFPFVIILIVYLLSIYMVSIRFHQSVRAETKKISSEIYSKKKFDLYIKMTKQR